LVLDRFLDRDPDPEHPDSEVDPVAETSNLRRVLGQMDSLPVEERRFVAGYAYILVRVAQADLEVSPPELEYMEHAVSTAGHLSEAQAVLIVELARRMNALYGATEDYTLTREFARTTTRAQREDLLRTAFAVSDADDDISEAERAELNEIGMELGFSLAEIEAIRAEFDDQPEPTEQ
jgi:tellurite resistance protein